MRYPQGSPVRIGPPDNPILVRDLTQSSKPLVDAGTITLTLQKPDATTATFTPTRDDVGTYHQDLTASDLSQVGPYQWKIVVTGNGAGVTFGNFDVFDPLTVAILPLQDAKDMLNIPQTNTTYDTEIQAWIDTILASLEKLTGGPLVNRSITEFVKVGHAYRSFSVRQRPLVSVTSITDNATGTALPTTDLDIDPNSGIVRRELQLPFWARGPFYTVVYTAGWGVPTPPAFNGAARIILDHLWATQHGPSVRPTLAGDDLAQDFGLGFAVPNRAVELMSPYLTEVYV